MKGKDWIIGMLLIILTYLLGYTVEQHEFAKIIIYYSVFFLTYVFVVKSIGDNESSLKYFIGLSILIRLMLVFSLPNLSNDVYRFIWDGRLLVQGFNPFDHLPKYFLENENGIKGITQELFEAYGSKNFYTVYPPLAQALFGSASWLFSDSIYWSSVVMKLWLLLFEIGSIILIIKLLSVLSLPKSNILLYALNPLIIFEIIGNLHFEGAMIFFLLLAVWLLIKSKFDRSAVAFALSICSKLLTLLFLPFFVYRLGWKKSTRYFFITGLACVILFMPIISGNFIQNFSNSLGLYFHKLEFNASLYYLLRWVCFKITGYNQIAVLGPLLGLTAGIVILYFAFVKQKYFKEILIESKILELLEYWLIAICIYLICTTTMHPWYTALPIVLCIFTNFRFPIVWSYLIFWTYINYSYPIYQENLWVVGIEYFLVFLWASFEYSSIRKKVLSL